MPSYGKIACLAVVGNEDGAHHVVGELLQALNDVGFTFALAARTYWVGEAMGNKNYIDLEHALRKTQEATKLMVLKRGSFGELSEEKSFSL